MSEDRTRILEMLKQGKITIDEAEQLLDALQGCTVADDIQLPNVETLVSARQKPKYLRVVIDDSEDHVNIRIPLGLIRAGMKFSSFLPADAQSKIQSSLGEKGMNIDLVNIKPETFDALIDSLGELNIDIDEKNSNEKVRIFCE
ncbi:MAG: SHOCT-like domain-containing protein [Armatimonadota bacterium]